jgi:hypothetical protein
MTPNTLPIQMTHFIAGGLGCMSPCCSLCFIFCNASKSGFRQQKVPQDIASSSLPLCLQPRLSTTTHTQTSHGVSSPRACLHCARSIRWRVRCAPISNVTTKHIDPQSLKEFIACVHCNFSGPGCLACQTQTLFPILTTLLHLLRLHLALPEMLTMSQVCWRPRLQHVLTGITCQNLGTRIVIRAFLACQYSMHAYHSCIWVGTICHKYLFSSPTSLLSQHPSARLALHQMLCTRSRLSAKASMAAPATMAPTAGVTASQS